MKVLFITQVFYPDNVAVSQHLSDLAFKLSQEGHQVTVYTSKFPYEEKHITYPATECINGVYIHRFNQTYFGKGSTIGRLIDFLTFYISATIRLLFIKKIEYDVILGTTVPPLLSYIGVLVARFKQIRFVYWVMDLQPELSIHSGLISEKSFLARALTRVGNYILKRSDTIISLDRFMTEYIVSRGVEPSNIKTIPVWPVIDNEYNGERLSNPFRLAHNFGSKIVIMYSGNHAYVHPLDTLLKTAYELRENNTFLFVFIGGGVRKKDVSDFRDRHKLDNIVQLPFQEREHIHISLGSSDIQVVILGDGQVGYTHPNKIYGALYIGKPVVYIGPQDSHVGDILSNVDGNILVNHDDVHTLKSSLLEFEKLTEEQRDVIGQSNKYFARKHFDPEQLKHKMLEAIVF